MQEHLHTFQEQANIAFEGMPVLEIESARTKAVYAN